MALRVAAPGTPSGCPARKPRWLSRSCSACTVSRVSPAGSFSGAGGEGAGAVDPVGQVADRQGEEGGVVPAHEHVEVPVHQEGGAPVSGGKDQGGVEARPPAGGSPSTRVTPRRRQTASGRGPVSLGQLVGNRSGSRTSRPQGMPGLPAQAAQEVRRRGQRVGQVPEVLAPVAVEVHGVAKEDRGHELEVPHGPRPGPAHPIERNQTVIDDPERRQELPAEPVAAPPIARQGGERIEHGRVPHVAAEARLDAPQRQQVRSWHAVAGGDAIEQGAVLARPAPGPLRPWPRSRVDSGTRRRSPSPRAAGDRLDHPLARTTFARVSSTSRSGHPRAPGSRFNAVRHRPGSDAGKARSAAELPASRSDASPAAMTVEIRTSRLRQ